MKLITGDSKIIAAARCQSESLDLRVTSQINIEIDEEGGRIFTGAMHISEARGDCEILGAARKQQLVVDAKTGGVGYPNS